MKKGLYVTLIALAGLAASAQETTSAATPVVELSAAGKLYEQAVAQRENGEPKLAVQTTAQIIALHAQDKEWLPKAELLSAKLYVELNLLECADATARQVEIIYEGTDAAEEAAAIRTEIEQLKADKESEGSTE